MRLEWFRNFKAPFQVLIFSGLIFILFLFYISLSKFIKPTITSLLVPPLKLCEDISANARYFLRFQDLAEENKRLKTKINELTTQLVELQEASLENERLRGLLSLPQRKSLRSCAALLIGKDSSNWTKTVMINKGALNGIKKEMPVVLGANLLGKVTEVYPFASKAALIVDFNSKVPAKVMRSREEGIVFGTHQARRSVCKMKYIQDVEIGDKIISSGLGKIYPKGLLIGEVVAVQDEKNHLYKIAEINPAVNFSSIEEVMVITGQ